MVIPPVQWESPIEAIVIKEDDNWLNLERKFNIPVSILKRYNSLKTLKAKQALRIPAKKIHQVKQGETSIGVATKYGLTFSEIIYLNDLTQPYELLIGQRLKIIEVKDFKKTSRLSLIWPIDGQIVKKFGQQEDGKYNNEISLVAEGEVKAGADGMVVYTGNEVGNYGNLVIIQHMRDWYTSYGNLSKITVKKDELVKSGQVIGIINNQSLYFGLRDGTTPVDPIKYLPKSKKRKN